MCTCTLPLRTAKAEIRGWPTRDMKLRGQTDVIGAFEPWEYWRKETCDAYILAKDKLSSPAAVKQSSVMAETKIPGIPIMCTTFPGCRRHAAVRCSWYRSIEQAKNMTLGCQVTGLMLYAAACMAVAIGLNMRIVTAFGTLGGAFVLAGLYMWNVLLDGFLNAIRVQVFWPYAHLAKGTILGTIFGLMMLGTSFTSINLVFHQKKRLKLADDAGEEEWAEDEEEEWDE